LGKPSEGDEVGKILTPHNQPPKLSEKSILKQTYCIGSLPPAIGVDDREIHLLLKANQKEVKAVRATLAIQFIQDR
jgi:hypothetical protein